MGLTASITKNVKLPSGQVFKGSPNDLGSVFMFALENIGNAPVSWVDIFIKQDAPRLYTFRLKSDRSILFTMELEEDKKMSKEYAAEFYTYTLTPSGADEFQAQATFYKEADFSGDPSDLDEVESFIIEELDDLPVGWDDLFIDQGEDMEYILCRRSDSIPVCRVVFIEYEEEI